MPQNNETLISSQKEKVIQICKLKKGTVLDYKLEWDAERLLILGKMYVMIGADKAERPCVTVKLAPEKGDFLRKVHTGNVVAGYYMNKTHWNTFYLDWPIPDSLLNEVLEESYQLIFSKLTKKAQKEILEAE